jgi:7 transmembrane sweet-taste receptor of 3 GCPR
LTWTDKVSIISTGFSIFGIIISAMVFIIFLRFSNTPVVKASSRELCYIVLYGMILSHASIFSILAHPTNITCAMSRVLPGVSFSMIYGSLLIKTNRISRLLPISQVVLAFILILIEFFVAIGVLLIEKPEVQYQYRHLRTLIICKESSFTILAPLAFIFILITLCVFFAIKTRNIPENFNETKFVGFAIYTTCIIWLAFFPIYYGSELQIITKCLCISSSSIVTLIFMFFPKIYIILLHPEKNVRSVFTTSKSIRCHIGAPRHSNISHKTSSSISSVRGISNDCDSTLQISIKKSCSCQTSIEKLSVAKVDASSSPIKCSMFEYIAPKQREASGNDLKRNFYLDYHKAPSSPSKTKIKAYNNELNVLPSSKRKLKRISSFDRGVPVYCAECIEMEKSQQQQQNSPLLHVKSNENKKNFPILVRKTQIFTVEKVPLKNNEYFYEKKKIAISEESLSECSISESACNLKKITIKLK